MHSTYMRIQTEYISLNNHWMICSSNDFQAHQQRSQWTCFSHTALLCIKMLSVTSQTVPAAPRIVVSPLSYSAGRQDCPPRVWYSPEIDASKFTLPILPDTPGGFQWLKYILLMELTIQNPTTSLFGDHPRQQWASAHQKIPTHQHLENELR